MDNGKKNTPKVLTTNEIRKNARDWTLAGDVGLLANLEQFSENIIKKTQETQSNFDELVDHYEELYTKVGNITNQFLALQNCQFVENRVYDEETPTDEKPQVKENNEAEKEKLLLMQYKEAVEIGVKILDTHFQEVQLPPNSDSDEEEDYSAGNSIIWKPKNPYASKKFPLLIGSAEWWADDLVGLGTQEDGLDTDKMISESESEVESLKSNEKLTKSSSSSSIENIKSMHQKPAFLESSDDLFGVDKNENQQNALENLVKGSPPLLKEPPNFLPNFEKDTIKKPETKREEQSVPNQSDEATIDKPIKVDNAFTRELMAKLVSVTSKNEKVEEKLRDKPTKVKIDDNLFDETDDSSDLFSTNVNKVQERGFEGKGLFDYDEDDELVKGEKDLFSKGDLFKATEESQPFDGNIFESTSAPKSSEKETVAVKKNSVNNLFDDLDDDDTLFAVTSVTDKPTGKSLPSMETEKENADKAKLTAATPKSVLENGEGLFDNIDTIDDDFFDSSGLFDVKVKVVEPGIVTDSKSEDLDLFSEVESKPSVNILVGKSVLEPENSKKEENSFGVSSSKELDSKKITALDSDEDDDLFSKGFKEEKKGSSQVLTLLNDDEDAVALFAEKPKPPDSASISSSRSSLFDDVTASKSLLASVFEKDKSVRPEEDLFNETEDSLFRGDVKRGKDLFSRKDGEKGMRSSLFDDCDDGDDLFSVVKKEDGKKKLVENVEKIREDIFEESKKPSLCVGGFMNDLGEDDLFGTLEPSPKLKKTKSEVIRKSDFVDDINDGDLFSDKQPSPKPKPPNSLSLKSKEPELKTKSVGRLNIPGDLKMKFESVTKNIFPVGIGTKPQSEETKADEKEVSDEAFQHSNLLKCPSKDRVKIPGRRRPQSRRARQEAIRNSGAWDDSISPASSSSNVTQSKDSLPSPAPSNPLSPSTDEEDFFKVPELDKNFEKEDQSIFKSDLFETDKNSKIDDNLLFDGAPVLSPLSPKKTNSKNEETPKIQKTDLLFESMKSKTVSIFDDDDNLEEDVDENLFKTSKPLAENSALFQGHEKNIEKTKKSLFDTDFDEEEDDDLFGGKIHVTPSKPANVGKTTEDSGENEKKNSSFVDPLGLMTENK